MQGQPAFADQDGPVSAVDRKNTKPKEEAKKQAAQNPEKNSGRKLEKYQPATEKVYISRGDAVARCVQNEDEVKAYLRTQGFRCYDNFSQMSIQGKIDVFHGARIVVAPTGANLTHCHAMQPGSTVLDFNHEFELEEECGWNSIADAIGVNWYSFPAITGDKGPRSGKGKKRKNNHLIVNLSKLQRALGAIS